MKNEFSASLLADRIETLCYQAGITKTKLLTDCNLNKSIVNNLKNGSVPSVDKIAVIADYFNVSTDYLLGRTEEPTTILGHINGNNSVQTIQDSPVGSYPVSNRTITDGLTNEFLEAFQRLNFSDKVEIMSLTMEKMKKGA